MASPFVWACTTKPRREYRQSFRSRSWPLNTDTYSVLGMKRLLPTFNTTHSCPSCSSRFLRNSMRTAHPDRGGGYEATSRIRAFADSSFTETPDARNAQRADCLQCVPMTREHWVAL